MFRLRTWALMMWKRGASKWMWDIKKYLWKYHFWVGVKHSTYCSSYNISCIYLPCEKCWMRICESDNLPGRSEIPFSLLLLTFILHIHILLFRKIFAWWTLNSIAIGLFHNFLLLCLKVTQSTVQYTGIFYLHKI